MKKFFLFLLGIFLMVLPLGLPPWGKKNKNPGTIILLNGTSSAGKTSIIRALQKRHGDAFEYVIGDEWLEPYALKHSIPESMPRNMQQRLILSDMFSYVKNLSQEGKNIFIDTVEFDVHYDHYCSILECDNVVKILVYCPLDILVEHVEKRNALGQPKEERPLNLSFGQFQDIYQLQKSTTEMVVDRIKTSRIKNALQIAEQEVRQLMKDSGATEQDAEKNINLFSKRFIEQFKLDSYEEIVLVPQHEWNLVVNCVHTPDKIAQVITSYLNQRK